MFRRVSIRVAALAVMGLVCGLRAATNVPPSSVSDGALTDGEVWNRGVEEYRAAVALPSDSSNRTAAVERALATLRPLMLSKTHGPRASELVGALQHERMQAAAAGDPAQAAQAAEDAAAAMQIALRAVPDDARANRNFTRATDRVAELREHAHVKQVLAAAQGQGPDAQLGGAVREARELMTAAQGVLTNEPVRQLVLSENLARRAQRLTDVWIPLKEALVREAAQNTTNQQQLAYAVNEVSAAQAATKKAATALADLDPAAQPALAQAEDVFTRFWKLTVMPPAAVAESIQCQTNAYIDLEKVNGRAWQPEALAFTQAFRAKFPQWAQAYEQQAQADTNKPPFTKESQNEINALAGEVEKIQLANEKREDPPSMLEALQKLERIRELLPKDKNGGGQGANNQQQQPPNPNEQNKDKDDKNKDNSDKDKNKDEPQPQPSEQQQDEKKEEPAEEKSEPPPKDEEVEALLQKAQDRNEQHENEKKARMRTVPLSPNERDW